jgi:hypothetical protein
MQRRSWYMPSDVAVQLAAAVTDLHHRLRRPKHAVLGALLTVALRHQGEAEALLNAGDGE